jgi:flagellar basal-body rod protein FlgB
MINRLTEGLDFQGQALMLRAQRQRLIASNIANADTPGFAAREMDFAATLRQATGTSSALAAGSQGAAGLATTKTGHIAQGVIDGAPATLQFARASQPSLDNNSVDMDRERASFADNTVKYEATLRFINGNVRTMLDALRSPNQG